MLIYTRRQLAHLPPPYLFSQSLRHIQRGHSSDQQDQLAYLAQDSFLHWKLNSSSLSAASIKYLTGPLRA